MADGIDPEKIPYRHGKTPGRTGYRKGCRCAQCRREHSDDMKAYRRNKKLQEAAESAGAAGIDDAPPSLEPSSMGVSWNAPNGVIEETLVAELDKLVGEPPFKKTLIVLARYNARVLDQIPAMERFDLVSGMESRLFNCFDRLRKVTDGAGAAGGAGMTPEQFLAGLAAADDD